MGVIKIHTALSCFLLVVGTLLGQQEELIPWKPDGKLQWSDFKGRPLKTEWAAATTASGISYEFSTSGPPEQMVVHFKVQTYFYPQKSWYRPELVDSNVLSHERLHFDITELFARKMRKQLRETVFTKNIKEEVRAIYRQILKECNAFQNKYDHQTNFSRNVEQQLIWNQKIAEALNE